MIRGMLNLSLRQLSSRSPQLRVGGFSRQLAIVWLSTQVSVHAHSRPWLEGTPTSLPLLSKEKVSPDTAMYRFGLKSAGKNEISNGSNTRDDPDTLGITVCSCILVTSPNDESLTRPYTPVSSRHQIGSFDLLVKTYPNGAMSTEFEKLEPGDEMIFKQVSPNYVRSRMD